MFADVRACPPVCLIQPTRFPEASRVDIFEYALALAGEGVKVHVIISENLAVGLPAGLTVHALGFPPDNTPARWWRFAAAARSIVRRLLREHDLRIVHLFNPSPATYLLGWMLSQQPDRPRIIYDVRTGGLGRRPSALLVNAMARSAPRFADRVIVLTDLLARRLYGDPYGKGIRVVSLGVNLASFRPSAVQRRGEFVFVYSGTLSKNRGLSSMLTAFSQVYRRHPQARLRIAGDGDDEVNLRMLAEKLDLHGAAEFLGRRPYSEVPAILAGADCGLSYVPDTAWFQPQPQLKTLEYLATGLPVVAVGAQGNRAVWKGLPPELLTGDSPGQFAAGMLFAIEHCDRFEVNFRGQAERYSWEVITRGSLLPLYLELLGEEVGSSVSS